MDDQVFRQIARVHEFFRDTSNLRLSEEHSNASKVVGMNWGYYRHEFVHSGRPNLHMEIGGYDFALKLA